MALVKHAHVNYDKQIRKNSGSVSCFACKNWYHKKFTSLDNNAFNKLASEFKKFRVSKWQCAKCDLEISIIEDKEKDLENNQLNIPLLKKIMNGVEAHVFMHLNPFKQELKEALEPT